MRSQNVLPLRPMFVSCSALSSIPLNSRRYTTSNDSSYMYESSPLSARFGINRYRGGWSEHQSRKQQQQQRLQQSRYYSSKTTNDIDDDDDDNKTKKTKSSLVSRIASTSSSIVRQGTGTIFSVGGFLGSSVISFVTDRRSFQDRFIEPIEALNKFLRTSGVDLELSKSLNKRLGINLCLLGRVHLYQVAEEEASKKKHRKQERRWPQTFESLYGDDASNAIDSSFLEEARRYMRYATAVYGQAMINAAEVDARGRLEGKVGRVTKETIATHISVPPGDIVLMDVSNYDGDANHLRHMVVVDHEHRKVVLSIRGTFSLEEIVLDVAAVSREFCGGEAHSEMANMAERVWTVAGPTVRNVLEMNPGYEFILTGHSLGAGAATLVTILVQNKNLLPKEQKIRCFAYASPPVYTPLEFVPKSVQATTNFVHQNDVVSFLSIQKVRQLFSSLRAVELYAHNHMSSRERYKVILGSSEPPKELIASVLEAEGKLLSPKKGAPVLYIPAKNTIWLKKDKENNNGDYRFEVSNAREMTQKVIRVYPDMFTDHFPSRYEHAFDHLIQEKSEEDEE
ncbi:alpha/beta-hydrolase [Fragilariopsis cylindrus CCMP1102]|uniref:sn-1-specific diacylglycerol lipase n=1 Tax=Fragilariopsis cylindrus CCMP1102 TaxID=635003 RepID=A0A1E7FT86_9STRA|nr:alpha/beta-hydrolase [Fragilariopsis cylindrus CCMP1102]|eukprot:OEU21033.1 alpha/beta-hydrolase [Fragilariopsis cylindrus CCMP1102]